MLRRFWLKLKVSSKPTILNLGCGITAYDQEDALKIFREMVVPIYGDREVVEIIENIDVSTLDETVIRPNMGIPSNRGVWFPLL
jgi:hypothetical protein